MPCSLLFSNSPVFSPTMLPSRVFTKASLSSTDTAITSSSSSPVSPLRICLQKPFGGLRSVEDVLSSTSPSSSPSVSTPASFSFSSLKRKRPAKIRIPFPFLNFPSISPVSEQWMNGVEVQSDGYSVCCKRGRREAMEDRYSAAVNLDGNPNQAFFGVFDGHGGSKAAEFAMQNIDNNILDELIADEGIEEAVRKGYVRTDSDFLKEEINGGACCLTALIRNGNIAVSNAGDCRAVISKAGAAEALTVDHRPNREDERHRIESRGGYVDCHRGVWRVHGSLAVSRGIGDRHLKNWVIADPETTVLKIEPEHEFLILASDGLWDKVGNQEAVDASRSHCVGSEGSPLEACKKLVELSSSRGSLDDITVMIIHLRRFVV